MPIRPIEDTPMKDTFQPGVSVSMEAQVSADMLPVLNGEQVFPVVSTAELVRLMELASRKLIQPYLNEDEEALGVQISVEHLATCGEGKTLSTTAELIEFRHQRARIDVAVFDGERLIATGVHIHKVMSKDRVLHALQAGQT